jgi:hypothetical protein
MLNLVKKFIVFSFFIKLLLHFVQPTNVYSGNTRL